MEIFGILELVLPIGDDTPQQPEGVLAVENQRLPGHAPGDGTMWFRFCPKSVKGFGFKMQSNVPALDGKTGGITATLPSPDIAQHPSAKFPNWWTDDPSPDVAEGSHHGAKTVSRWREDFLGDFAQRILRCQSPASAETASHILPVETMSPLKPRMVVLTDVSTWETDDSESLVRLLVHADMFEIEGLVFTTGWSLETTRDDFMDLIRDAINAYEKDLPNLLKRSHQDGHLHDNSQQEIGYWPSPKYLRDRTMFGSKNRGYSHIGANNISPGSNLIIKLADEDDDRPVWVTVWGGGNTLAQAIWQVKQERSEDELKAFLHKLRTYTITDQDGAQKPGNVINWSESSHQWMRREFEKDLLFIWDECAWKYQNGTGRSKWNEYVTHIQNHGHLGRVYPKYKYGVEGDTPAFLHIMPNGLNNPDIPRHVGWGGYFVWGKGPDNGTYAYTNHQDSANSISTKYQEYFYPATFNNFTARMDWAKDGRGNRNPIVVINDDKDIDIITIYPLQGTTVTLDASKSDDPDGDKLTFKWWILSEAGTYTEDVNIANRSSSRAMVNVPPNSAGKSFHVICEVTDDGTHNLTSYRRIILYQKIKRSRTSRLSSPHKLCDYTETIRKECFMRPELTMVLVFLFSLGPAQVGAHTDSPIMHSNVEYGRAAGEKLLLDVCEPNSDGPFPVAIYVHGGGWTGGDKANPDDAPVMDLLTEARFTWFSINYRLAPQHRWPACVNDVQTAIRWVKANAARYKGDPSRIALIGYSAGGHLASFAATVVDDSVRVQAVVGCAPLTDFVQELPKRGNILGRAQRGLLNRPEALTPESLGMLKALSPINHIRPGLPPFLLIHGDADQSVPYEQSLAFQAKLRAHDVRCNVIPLPGAPHRLTKWNQHLPNYDSRAIAWLRETLGCQEGIDK